jgi:hypothetical protein
MAWIPVDQALPTHFKTTRAAKIAGVSTETLIGHLITLWLWAVDNAPDGDLDGFGAQEIELAANWPGEKGLLHEALKGCGKARGVGFIEVSRGGAVQLHDWDEYGGKAGAQRDKWRELKRRQRHNQAQSTGTVHPCPVEVPSQKRREEKDQDQVHTLVSRGSPKDTFPAWWKVYGSRGSKADAFACYAYWITKGASADDLLKAARNYVASCSVQDRLLKDGSTFLAKKPNRWQEWVEGVVPVVALGNPTTEDRRILCRECEQEVTSEQMEEAFWAEGKGWTHRACAQNAPRAARPAVALDLGVI